MARVHVCLQFEHKTTESLSQWIHEPIAAGAGNRPLRQLQKGIEEGPHAEIGHRGTKKHRGQFSGVNHL